MRLIERYIFRKIANAAVMVFIALGAMVWLSQALRQFDLVTANGQSVWTFLYVSALLIPALVAIVLPVGLLIAVIYTFSSLNTDSELVVINASGAPQSAVLKPVLLNGAIVGLLVAAMTLYFAPLSLRAWQILITDVRGNILTTILQPGQFLSPARGLTIHVRGRNQDGSLQGIFVSDDRDPAQSSTYLAERGAVLDNPLGVFLIMSNGTIQQRNKLDQSISMIEFSSYALDLSSFATGGSAPQLHPSERDTLYLLHPDPNDPYFRQFPGKFRSELHDRLVSPIYALLFAVVPLLFLGQAQSSRQNRSANAALAVLIVVALRALGGILPGFAEQSTFAILLMYAVPIGGTLIASLLVLNGNQVQPPERLVAFAESAFARASGLLRRGEATASGS
jgi:lipopolysaccharide export system permease protein